MLVVKVEHWVGRGVGYRPKEKGSWLEALGRSCFQFTCSLYHPTFNAQGSLLVKPHWGQHCFPDGHTSLPVLSPGVSGSGCGDRWNPGPKGSREVPAKCGCRNQPERGGQRFWWWALCPRQPSL